jgi:HlyD family secretion protein
MTNTTLPLTARHRVGEPRFQSRRWFWLALILLIAVGGFWGALYALPLDPSRPSAFERRSLPARVSALGRLAPEGEVVAVAPPTLIGASAGTRVDQLLVTVGDEVKAGQIVAILDTQRSRAATVLEAKAKVEVAKAKLAQVQAGPKHHEVSAQQAVIRRSEADLTAAQEEFERTERLIHAKAVSREEYTVSRQKFAQVRATLEQSKAQLDSLKTIRQVDVKAAEAEVFQAQASLAVAQEDLQHTQVRSPLSGRVLRIRARPGERAGDQGILDVGNTNVMHVVAEIYEEDVGKVSIGQTAQVRVPTLGVGLSGTVVSKDLIVSRKVIFSNDPVADIDARVVEVRIRLSAVDGARVAGLSNARVEVVIDLSGVTQ